MKHAKRMLALTLIVLPILAAAQMASNTRIVAKVPFPFVVGDKHVPAGQWTVESIAPGTVMIRNVAAVHCEGRLVSVLEGGYNPPVLAECVETHLRSLLAPQ